MKISDLIKIDEFDLLQPAFEDSEIRSAYTSDLLSDVIANAEPDSVLITIQAHKNSVAVAAMVGIRAIIICNSCEPIDDMIAVAESESIAIFRTKQNQFVTSCQIGKILSL